jgi:DNA-binding SARP family transcriptional activator
MEFRVLGPLEANDGTTPLALGGRKQRALLARLVLDVNRAIPMQRLLDDLWGEDVPASATKMVQIYVSQLRKVLPADVLRTQPPGYLVASEPEAVDAVRFGTLRNEGAAALAAGDVATAATRLREALELWRGPPLAEFTDEPFAKVEGAHLEELRLTCVQERIEADLALGRHADAVSELEALVAEHPLREPLHGQLMLALYRSGRQAEALAAYDHFRRTLDEELGIEPTEPLKQLQFKILNQDIALAPPPHPRPRGAPRVTSGFVGRAAELEALDAAFREAEAGRGSTILLGGAAGIGKTRLIRELSGTAEGRGATLLEGRCIQLIGSGLPYLPVVDALRPLCGAPQLTELVPDLRELPRLVAGLVDGAPPPSEEETRAASRVRLFSEVLAVVDRLSTDDVVVLVLEDLHWADESTLDLVAYLAHAVPGRRVLFVASYRSDEAGTGERLQVFVTGLAGAPEVTTRQLEPLSRDEVATIVAAGGGDGLSQAMSEAILVRAQGNPFFAHELLAATTRGQTALPPGLRDVLLAKVARLDPIARQVLRVAAVTGRDVTYALLAAVVPADELALAEALRQAVEREVLEPDRATRGFRFRHALFAEAVYESLLPGEREQLHEQLARVLTEEPALAAPGAEAAETAHHWAAAGRPLEALVASLEAAREAEAVSGLTEAMRHVERVLELWDAVPGAEELAGFALPSVLDWAAELGEAELEARVNIEEARHLYPTAVVLESLAVRTSPPFSEAALRALRDANARFRAAARDAPAASAADDDFHRVLTERCDNTLLIAALRPVKQALLRYEGFYMRDPERVAASAAQHDAIIEALERGDQAAAAQLVRANLADGLPDLSGAIES